MSRLGRDDQFTAFQGDAIYPIVRQLADILLQQAIAHQQEPATGGGYDASVEFLLRPLLPVIAAIENLMKSDTPALPERPDCH